MNNYNNIVILTGAGISAESGLKTFRDNDGLWETHKVEDVATPEAFARDPVMVQRFYNQRRSNLLTTEPNAAHDALAKLEAEHKGSVTLITQNVDDLHERAGSKNIIHMHGELLKVRCNACAMIITTDQDIETTTNCPACGFDGTLRPHIVWFGEMPFYMEKIDKAMSQADLFISIGTSGNVYPAAGFVHHVRSLGTAHCVELNKEPSDGINQFHEAHQGLAAEIVPKFVDKLLTTS
jgi:NAD-dependent deacetylase